MKKIRSAEREKTRHGSSSEVRNIPTVNSNEVGNSSVMQEGSLDESFEIRIAFQLLEVALRPGFFFEPRFEFNGFSQP